jgi:uncharacterized protein
MKIITENIKKTVAYLKREFNESEYLKAHENEKQYRYYHTIRVASIGQEIALAENLNEEALVIGCLLHDISYVKTFSSQEDIRNHGRIAAKIAREFLKTLTLDAGLVAEILYGIAIHVDDKADFEGERTKLALSISDCDNIDRFDAYRLYEGLLGSNLNTMSFDKQIEFVEKITTRLKELLNFDMATDTAKKLWRDKVNYQINFYERLRKQLGQSLLNY